jgi:tetratricopeptide (TPR) repeat protein
MQLSITGRESELEFLQKYLANATRGTGSVIMVGGLAGIGKSRVCEELIAISKRAGFLVLVGSCLPGAPLPYLPFREAFKGLLRENEVALFESLGQSQVEEHEGHQIDGISKQKLSIPPKPIGVVGVERNSAMERLMLFTYQLLRRQSGERPVLIVLEDLHCADTASLQLLLFLARNIWNLKVVIIGTFRPEEIEIGQEGIPHPLKNLLTNQEPGESWKTLILSPLLEDDIRNIIEDIMKGEIDDEIARRVMNDSAGNPLFAIELVHYLAESNAMEFKNGVWVKSSEEGLTVPSTIHEVLIRRLDRLRTKERRVIDCASVFGRGFEAPLISSIIGAPLNEVESCLETVVRVHKLILPVDGEYEFSHDLIRRTAYERISLPRRKEMHLRLGELLERMPNRTLRAGELSNHYCAAEVRGKCIEYSIMAGQMYMERFSATEAVKYFNRADKMLDAAGDEERAALVHEGLGDAYEEIGRYESSFKEYQIAIDNASLSATKGRLFRKCSVVWLPTRLGNGSIEPALRYLDLAEAEHLDPLERGEVMIGRGMLRYLIGEYTEAERLAEGGIALFEADRAFPRLAWELSQLAFLKMSLGRPKEAMGALRRALEIFEEYPWPRGEYQAKLSLGEILLMMGDYQGAMMQLEGTVEQSANLGDFRISSYACHYLSLIHEANDSKAMAKQMAEISHEMALRSGNTIMVAMPETTLVRLSLMGGEIPKAEALLDSLRKTVEGLNREFKIPLWGLLSASEALMFYFKGDMIQANLKFKESIELFTDVQMGAYYRAMTRLWYAEALEEQGEAERALQQLRCAYKEYSQLDNATDMMRVSQRVDRLVNLR